MLDNNFWLDGVSASDYGIVLQREIEFEAPEAVVETVSVPGRNGDIIYPHGSFKNIKGTASCYCLDMDVSRVVACVNSWLMKGTSYVKLETAAEPQFYRMARLVRGANLKAPLNRVNAFELEFDCKPQKFLKRGDAEITFDTGYNRIYNESYCEALPIITVQGSGLGYLTVNGSTGQTLTFADCDNVTVDCERQKATRGTTNMNSAVSGVYPKLKAGENTISFSEGITSVTIRPRWWTL